MNFGLVIQTQKQDLGFVRPWGYLKECVTLDLSCYELRYMIWSWALEKIYDKLSVNPKTWNLKIKFKNKVYNTFSSDFGTNDILYNHLQIHLKL